MTARRKRRDIPQGNINAPERPYTMAQSKLQDAAEARIAKRAGCMISDSGPGYTMVFVSRKFTSVTTVNPQGFQPLTRQDEIMVAVPVVMLFASGAVVKPWLNRLKSLGGQVVTVRRLEDAMEALNG